MQKRVVLASGSPRRKDILNEIGVDFEIVPSTVDETDLSQKYKNRPRKLVEKLSFVKAISVVKQLENTDCQNTYKSRECDFNSAKCADKTQVLSNGGTVVIGADTVVAYKNEVFGKPRSRDDAVGMISRLCGKWHKVYTGVTIVDNGKSKTFCVRSLVKIKDLSLQEIENYVDTCNPLDKAGAYGIQDRHVVEKYKGSYTNIVGFPQEKLTKALKRVKVI